ncbi:MAG: CAP domain-containing protein [Myxococcota bacterium]
MQALLRCSRDALVGVAAFLATTGCGGDGAPCFEPTDPVAEEGLLAGTTAAHNQVRAEASPTPEPALEPLAWDPDVAAIAQGWASCLAERGCNLEHNPDRGPHGENIFWSSELELDGAHVVQSWASEAPCYDYETGDCDEEACPFGCGHYTQIVWRSTERVGCGFAQCPEEGGVVWVCNYAPPGNIRGQSPY